MTGIRDLVSSGRADASERAPSLLRRLGIGASQSRRGGRGPAAESDVVLAAHGARITSGRELARSEGRLLEASRALERRAPRARVDTRTFERAVGSETVERTENVEIQTEIVTPATAASQSSIVFDAVDETVAVSGSQIRFNINGPNVRVDVGAGGATLEDLTELINEDSQNQGRLLASIVSDGDGFRLRVETTETGSNAQIRVSRDRFDAPLTGTPTTPPLFGRYSIIDAELADRYGDDEIVEQATTSETITTSYEVPVFEQVEETTYVDDAEFDALIREFSDAFNALQAQLGDRTGLSTLVGAATNDTLRAGKASLSDSLSTLVTRFAAGENIATTALADLGLERDATGGLEFDSLRLQQAIADSPERVAAILSTGGESLAREVGRAVREQFQLATMPSRTLGVSKGSAFTDAEAGARSRFRLVETLFRR